MLWKKRPTWSCPKTVPVYYPQWNLCHQTQELLFYPHDIACCICRDCETYFGRESLQPITRDNSVVCETQYSKVVPLEGGEVGDQTLNVIEVNTELWVLRFSLLCNWGFLSSGRCCCFTRKVVPDVLKEHVIFKMSELFTQRCSITSWRTRILKYRIPTYMPY
jgi:hypothetical protein